MKNSILLVICLFAVITLRADYLEYRVRVWGITNSVIKVKHEKSDTLGVFDVHVQTLSAVSIFSNVDNYYYSTYTNGFNTNYLRKKIQQSNYTENREVFIRDNIAYMIDYTKDTEGEYPVFEDTCDLFCGLFRMSKDAEKEGSFHIFSNRHLWKVNYKPAGIETIKTELGKVEAYRLEIYFTQLTEGDFKCTDIFTNNVMKENQLLELWISTDEDRIPLRALLHKNKFRVYWDIVEYRNQDD
ncbi:MAG: DUF3108 domain-containing protein [Candidatus Zophobacter franzmannii]|nr:DUF3108 domain-containing protein [Candidatus Zophobacter franzmannii]